MAQADGVVANGTGSAVRSDINTQYAALWSNHSGSTEPSSGKVAFQTWADTNTGYLKIRNAANNAWIQLFKLDGTDLANICRLTGSTNNQLTTVTSANAIQGEANLTFDGNTLSQTIASSGHGASIKTTNDVYPQVTLGANRSSENNSLGYVRAQWNNTDVAAIDFLAGPDTTNKDDGKIGFNTRPSGGGMTRRLTIDSSGRLLLGTTTEGAAAADDLTVATSGDTGITVRSGTSSSGNLFFSDGTSGNSEIRGYVQYLHSSNDLLFGTNAGERLRILSGGGLTFNGDTAAANALNEYEEGSFTAAIGVDSGTDPSQNAYTHRYAYYIKIGKIVHWKVDIKFGAISQSGSGNAVIMGLPFTSSASSQSFGCTFSSGYSQSWGTDNFPIAGYMNVNDTKCNLMNNTINNGNSHCQASGIVNGTRLICGGTYMTDS